MFPIIEIKDILILVAGHLLGALVLSVISELITLGLP